jgi:hypothetical protein
LSDDGNTLAVGARLEDSGLTGVTPGVVSEATSGNAASDSGAVYVYTRTAGTWSQQAYVKASNAGANDNFGNSVALSGDGNTLAVGAPFENSSTTGINSAPDDSTFFAGAVYVYFRSAGAWSQQAYVKGSNTEGFNLSNGDGADLFGTAVALSGDGNTLAVGAPGEDSGLTGVTANPVNEAASGNAVSNSGAVYVFNRTGATWSQQAYVKASNTGEGDNFGNSVALSGDGNMLAVGAPFEDGDATGVGGASNESAADAGAAYVYTRSGGAWSHQAYVKASNTGFGDNFGTSVALSSDGNALAIGAPFEGSAATGIGGSQADDCSAPNPFSCAAGSGAVYVYSRNASTGAWTQQAYVKASNSGTDDRFGNVIAGNSVALSGDGNTLAVGAELEDGGGTGIDSSTGVVSVPDDTANNAGAVYLY